MTQMNLNNGLSVSNLPDGNLVSQGDLKQSINLTNNKARQYSEAALKYSNEAKANMELAKYYAEHNSDVTQGDLEDLETELSAQIALKQDAGSYATESALAAKQDIISDLETIRSGAGAGATAIQQGDNISVLTNDSGYLTSTDITGKANTSLSNLADAGDIYGSGLALPATNHYESITVGASGTEYTAPANGWFAAAGQSTATGQRLTLNNTDSGMITIIYGNGSYNRGIYIPVLKGQSVLFVYEGNVTSLRFIYAQGSVSEHIVS